MPLRTGRDSVNLIVTMALADRDYYRDDDRDWSFLPGRVTFGLILVILAIFILQVINKSAPGFLDPLRYWGSFQIDLVLRGELWRFVTAPFVHNAESIFPIACSLIALYSCGRWLENELGGPEFLAYFLAAVIVTQAAEFLARFTGLLNPNVYSNGSLGPVTAVVVLCAFRHPKSVVYLFVFPVPMWAVAAIWVGLSCIDLKGFDGRDALARVLAGAAFAGAYHTANIRLTSRFQRGTRRVRPRLRVVSADELLEEETVAPVAAKSRARTEPSLDEHLEAKVDFVLEKVAKTGRDSLTADEKAILLKAGEIYRKRRGN
ncbi:hypothetical protein BH11PLA2_BH11PLA2_41810 [soil metagenome]